MFPKRDSQYLSDVKLSYRASPPTLLCWTLPYALWGHLESVEETSFLFSSQTRLAFSSRLLFQALGFSQSGIMSYCQHLSLGASWSYSQAEWEGVWVPGALGALPHKCFLCSYCVQSGLLALKQFQERAVRNWSTGFKEEDKIVWTQDHSFIHWF